MKFVESWLQRPTAMSAPARLRLPILRVAAAVPVTASLSGGRATRPRDGTARGAGARGLVGAGIGRVGGPERVVEGKAGDVVAEPVVVHARPGDAPRPAELGVGAHVLGQVPDGLRRLHDVAEPEGRPRVRTVARAALPEVGELHIEVTGPEGGGEVRPLPVEHEVDVGGGGVERRRDERIEEVVIDAGAGRSDDRLVREL